MKFAIRNRWTESVQFTAEIDCEADASEGVKRGLAVKWALQTGADLTWANLTGAVLTDANLTRANLTDADLTRADLTGADLTRADLTRANLTDANLTRANLTRADLTGADLTRAYLTRANLTRAYLTRANLTDANLTDIKDDLYLILSENPAEVGGLLQALNAGSVDGSTYEGACACLVGTIANVRGVSVDMFHRDSNRPAERWFMGISKGDTPQTSPICKITADWVWEWRAIHKDAAP